MNIPAINLSTEEVEEDDEQVESELEHKEEEDVEPPTLKNPTGYLETLRFKSINGFW
jgi:hypothetical protein